uniref:Uncharacterized protein n=1 Tax=Anguilla anguilla TaxID=7936 RepID=A0A0E9V8W3_ANGAN
MRSYASAPHLCCSYITDFHIFAFVLFHQPSWETHKISIEAWPRQSKSCSLYN